MKKRLVVLACLLAVAVSVFCVTGYIRWTQRLAPSAVEPTDNVVPPTAEQLQPNLFVHVSADLINARLTEPVDRTAPVHEVILRTQISGTSHTIGRATAQFAPDSKAAVIDIIYHGTAKSETVGRHGPVTIDSEGTTSIAARKRVLINADGIKATPAVANAITHTKTTGIEAKRPIVERIADRRTDAERPTTDQIVAKNTEQTVDNNMNQAVDKMVKEADDAFHQRLCRPLKDLGLFPNKLLFSTTKDALRVGVLWARGSQHGAATSPPELNPFGDVGVQVHESFVNNLAAAKLAGQRISQETVRDKVTELLGSLPEPADSSKTPGPWAITFAEEKPITIRLSDDLIKLTVYAQKYVRGKTTYPAMDIVVEYKIEFVEGTFKAVRQGNVHILPPGYGAGDKRLPFQEAIICDVLDYWFGDVLAKEIVRKGFTPRGKWAHIGTFHPIQVEAKDGWLVLGWKRTPDETPAAK